MKSTTFPRPYVYARVAAFSLECPSCGAVDTIRTGGRRWRSANFNPLTCRWFCRSCRRLFAVGLAVWPVAPTGNRSQRWAMPLDCQPKPDQFSALRQLHNRALVRKTPRRCRDSINLMDCPCLDREDIDPACPFHAAEG